MSSTNKTANYELSQFVGTDIPSILGDYNGDMRKIDAAIGEVASSAGSSASAVSALAGRVTTVENNMQTLEGAQTVTNQRSVQNQVAITAIQAQIPEGASSENQLVTAEELTEVSDSVKDIDDTLANIVPSSASVSNKLATMSDITGASGPDLIYRNVDDPNFPQSGTIGSVLKYIYDNVINTLDLYKKDFIKLTMNAYDGTNRVQGMFIPTSAFISDYTVTSIKYDGNTSSYVHQQVIFTNDASSCHCYLADRTDIASNTMSSFSITIAG